VAGGARRQWLQACLPDGYRPQGSCSLVQAVPGCSGWTRGRDRLAWRRPRGRRR
jgi:hypothetical protein